MTYQYQRGADGRSIPATDYPPIPDAVEFFNGYGYEVPSIVHHWEWRTDYQKWGALVTFASGWRGITNPKPAPLAQDEVPK